MKEFLIAVVVTVVVAAGLVLAFSGRHATNGQPDYALTAATPEAPSASATAFPTSTQAAASTAAAGSGGAASGGASAGQALATANGCAACHSTTGAAGVGPTWKGLYGSTVPLADGSSVTADDAYIHESIVSPNAKIVKGFSPNIMPQTFGQSLSADQINQLIDYIKSLK